jgi:predicted RNA polymerase sigma factor
VTTSLEALVRSHWWRAVASVTRATGGDLALAEDAVQDACAAALAQWAVEGTPASPLGWLNDTRRPARMDAAADIVLLEDQDRARWDSGRIAEGPGRGCRERVPGRAGGGAAGRRATLHRQAHPPAGA